jgi:hypothetical protein
MYPHVILPVMSHIATTVDANKAEYAPCSPHNPAMYFHIIWIPLRIITDLTLILQIGFSNLIKESNF